MAHRPLWQAARLPPKKRPDDCAIVSIYVNIHRDIQNNNIAKNDTIILSDGALAYHPDASDLFIVIINIAVINTRGAQINGKYSKINFSYPLM